jgi:hypothetical protein
MFQIVPYTDEVVVNSLDCFQVNGTSDMQVGVTLLKKICWSQRKFQLSSGHYKVLQYEKCFIISK